MASIPTTHYFLAINQDSIYLGDFWIPFENPAHFTVKKNFTVDVSFKGAMGLTENVVIEFELLTAKKVAEFVRGLLRCTKVRLISDSPPKRPLYSISPTAMSKIESTESFEEYANTEWDHVHFIFSEMAKKFPRIKSASSFFLYAYRYLEGLGQLQFPYQAEIIKNAYKSLSKVPLEPEEEETFLSLGGRQVRNSGQRNRAAKS